MWSNTSAKNIKKIQRRENLRLYGIEEKEDEDPEKFSREFMKVALHVDPTDMEFQIIHRVGQRRDFEGRPRAIIARFLRYLSGPGVNFFEIQQFKGNEVWYVFPLAEENSRTKEETSSQAIEGT
jgi:hypothetical protein